MIMEGSVRVVLIIIAIMLVSGLSGLVGSQFFPSSSSMIVNPSLSFFHKNSHHSESDKVAYVMVFTDADVTSVLAVAQITSRMRKVKSRADFVVVFDEDKLPQDWEQVKQIYYGMGATKVLEASTAALNNATANKDLWQGVFVRLIAFTLVEYARMIWIDADWVMVKNCDEAFSYPAPAMVQWEAPTSLNGGFFLFKPSLALYNDVIRALERIPNNITERKDAERRSALAPLGSPEQKAESLLTDQYTDQGFLFAYFSSDEAIDKGYGEMNVLPTVYNVHDVFVWFTKENFPDSQWREAFGWLFMLGPNRHHIRGVHLIEKPYTRLDSNPEVDRHNTSQNKALEGYNCLWWRAAWDSLQQVEKTAQFASYADQAHIVKFKSDNCREAAVRLVEVNVQ